MFPISKATVGQGALGSATNTTLVRLWSGGTGIPPVLERIVSPTQRRSGSAAESLGAILRALAAAATLPTPMERAREIRTALSGCDVTTLDATYGSLGLGTRLGSTPDERRDRIVAHVAKHGPMRLIAPRGASFSDEDLRSLLAFVAALVARGAEDDALLILHALPSNNSGGGTPPNRRLPELLNLPGRHVLRDQSREAVYAEILSHLRTHSDIPLPPPLRAPPAEARSRQVGRHQTNTLDWLAELDEATRAELLERRIRSRVRVLPSGCWQWQGRLTAYGYGALDLLGHMQLQAHRAALVLATGQPIVMPVVRHLCEPRMGSAGKRCVRPDHLAQASHVENGEDRRQLSNEEVLRIAAYAREHRPEKSWVAIGHQFGISAQVAADIAYGRARFSHVEGLIPLPPPAKRPWREVDAPLADAWWFDSPSGYIATFLKRRSAPAGGGCRIWGQVSKANGYGKVLLRLRAADGSTVRMNIQAHIVAWALHHRRSPQEGHHIDHLCGNRACVAPEHLEEVLAVENVRRAPRREGARNPATKLTAEVVCAMRERFAADSTVTLRELAAAFGVTRPLVKAILLGGIWRSAGGPTCTREEFHQRTLRARELRKHD